MANLEKPETENLKKFLKKIVPGIIDSVVDEADKMEKEGEKFNIASIGKLFRRSTPPELQNVLQDINREEKKALPDGTDTNNNQ